MLLRYCLNDSELVPVAPIIIGSITYFYIPHALFITTTTTTNTTISTAATTTTKLLNFSARFTEKVLDYYEKKRNLSYNKV